MATENGLYYCMNAGNGEFRLQAVRYGTDGWYCLCCIMEPPTDLVFEKFEDLVGGDLDHFDATDYFSGGHDTRPVRCAGDISVDPSGMYVLSIGIDPQQALSLATYKAANILEGYDR